MKNKSVLTDMTKGPIAPQILNFTLPLIIGNFCVLAYNAADAIIVGYYAGEDALAALGAATPIMNMMLFLMIGICLGMSILTGIYFGSGEIEKLKREISTALIGGSVFTIILVLLGYFLSENILLLMGTPQEILHESTYFLQVIFIGLIFSFIYNIYAALLRSMGSSLPSLYFLIISAIINVVLDLIFVKYLHLGLKGAAWGTVIAEFCAALFCVIYSYIKVPLLRLGLKDLIFDWSLFKLTVHYSSVSAMQQLTLQIGKFLVQGAINPLGIPAIAAFNAVNRVDDFIFVVQQNIAHGTTGFMAQNKGARQIKRMRNGFKSGLIMVLIYTFFASITVFSFAPQIIHAFVGNEADSVKELGIDYLKIMAIIYVLPAITNIFQGYFRGIGKLNITLNATFVQIIFRVIAAYILATNYSVTGMAWACLVGWVFMLLYELPLFIKFWKNPRKSIIQSV